MAKTLEYYLNLPYTIELRNTPGEGWFARVKELTGCMSQGETAEEAVAMIQEAMQGWLEVALEHGDPIPEPQPDEEFSGKFVVRVPRSLHRELVAAAEREGVSLNQFINTALAQAIGRVTPTHLPAGRACLQPALVASRSGHLVRPGLLLRPGGAHPERRAHAPRAVGALP